MNTILVPQLPPMSRDATEELRLAVYLVYVLTLVALNKNRFLARGVKRRWWHLTKLEHPLTRSHQIDQAVYTLQVKLQALLTPPEQQGN